MVLVARECVKIVGFEPQAEFMLVGDSQPSISRVSRTSGNEDSSGCYFNVLTKSWCNTNALDHVPFVFLLCIDP